jgi:hypothetical protein
LAVPQGFFSSLLEAEEGGGHEAEDEDDESQESGETAWRVEGNGIVDWGDAEKTEAEEKSGPNIPAVPEEIAERKKGEREKKGGKAVKAGIEGAENVAAIELSCREEVKCRGEKTDPGGAANGMKQ